MANEGSHTCSVSIPPSVSMMASLILGFCSLRRLKLGVCIWAHRLGSDVVEHLEQHPHSGCHARASSIELQQGLLHASWRSGRLRGELLGLHVQCFVDWGSRSPEQLGGSKKYCSMFAC